MIALPIFSNLSRNAAAVLLIAGLAGCASQPVPPAEPERLVADARTTLSNFIRDPNQTWIQDNLNQARAVLIAPQIVRAGFIFGGSGGTGVLVLKDPDKKDWTEPAFYTLGSVTFGLQIGGEAAEVVMLVMTQKAVDTLFSTSMKLGADASIAAGPVGTGAKANIVADFISFAKSKGAYAGLNLEGSALDVRDSLNKAYYGKEVRPVDILVKRAVSNAGAKGLRNDLLKASK